MKKLFKSILLVMLTFTTYGQDRCDTCAVCDVCTVEGRQVTYMGLAAWTGVYNQLSEIGLIDATPVQAWFSYESLVDIYQSIYPTDSLDSASRGTIVFRFYLDEPEVEGPGAPKIAIANCGDSSQYLTDFNDIVPYDSLSEEFGSWSDLNSISSGLIPVTSYNYCWNAIGKNITTNGLVIMILAHTVSPNDSINYNVPATLEGYVAFDLAIGYTSKAFEPLVPYGIATTASDFAAPCPKNCVGTDQ